jgi:alpha,alpha-trehalase
MGASTCIHDFALTPFLLPPLLPSTQTQQNATYSLSDIETTNVLPVDLNSYLYRMEQNLARLHELQATAALPTTTAIATVSPDLLVSDAAVAYTQAAARRAQAMDAFMWSDEQGFWQDYVVTPPVAGERAAPGSGVVSVSSFLPLWGRVLDNPALEDGARKGVAALEGLKGSGLLQVGGVQTTLQQTEEQWDAPNAWAPLQQMLIEGLEGVGSAEASELARGLAKAWLESNYLGWANTGQMYEKYNALVPGARGEGGEYVPQIGFGWSNGVVLHLLNTYGETLSTPPGMPEDPATIELKAVVGRQAARSGGRTRSDGGLRE